MEDFTSTQRLGETDEIRNGRRGYVVVTVRISTTVGSFTTVNHDVIGHMTRASFTGEHYGPEASYVRRELRDPHSAGQIGGYADDPTRSSLNQITTPAPGWTLEEIGELESLWSEWHLNDMSAACAHMDEATLVREDNGWGGTRISTTDPRNVCPVTGYRHGHSWLARQIPEDVLARIVYLMRDRSADLYAARGYDAAGKAVTA